MYRKFVFLLFFLPVILYAQNVGIGTSTPDVSAKLHVRDAQRGVLLPKVSLSNVITFGLTGNSLTEGMMVYNTNAAVVGGCGKGYYYWNGAVWVCMQGTSSGPSPAPLQYQTIIYTVDGF